MKRGMGLLGAVVLVGLLALMAAVRLAGDDPGRWHVVVPQMEGEVGAGAPLVVVVSKGAMGFVPHADGQAVLARLAAVAGAEPRTVLLAGSATTGRMTWVARSALWGFPDYITAEVVPGGVRLWSRQRYGSGDYGINAARLRRWVAGL